jgi:hypothetical protein
MAHHEVPQEHVDHAVARAVGEHQACLALNGVEAVDGLKSAALEDLGERTALLVGDDEVQVVEVAPEGVRGSAVSIGVQPAADAAERLQRNPLLPRVGGDRDREIDQCRRVRTSRRPLRRRWRIGGLGEAQD